MSTPAESGHVSSLRGKREICPVATLRHLEGHICELRAAVGKRAARISDDRTPDDEEVFHVTRDDIDQAFAEVFKTEASGTTM